MAEIKVKEILFCDEINYLTMQALMEKCANEKEVILLLCSKGGNPESAIAFFNFIKLKAINITVNVLSNCESAALILLCAGNRRIAAKNCTFFIHQTTKSWSSDWCFNEKEIQDILISLQSLNKRSIDVIAEVTKKPFDEIKALKYNETLLNAQQAFELGLLTEKPY